MSKFDNLNDTFNVESEVVEVKVEEKSIEKPQDEIQKDQILKDYEYTRGNLYSLIEKGQEAVNGPMNLALSRRWREALSGSTALCITRSLMTTSLA